MSTAGWCRDFLATMIATTLLLAWRLDACAEYLRARKRARSSSLIQYGTQPRSNYNSLSYARQGTRLILASLSTTSRVRDACACAKPEDANVCQALVSLDSNRITHLVVKPRALAARQRIHCRLNPFRCVAWRSVRRLRRVLMTHNNCTGVCDGSYVMFCD